MFFFCSRGTVLNNNNKGKWFKFNDTVVEEFEMTDAAVEAECFGGTYKAKVYDQCTYFCILHKLYICSYVILENHKKSVWQ